MGQNKYRPPNITPVEEIFETYPQLQNQFSSMWYFFVLFPKQGEAYGPKQLMFSFASKVGKKYGVRPNDLEDPYPWQEGMKVIKDNPVERDFMTTAVGWCFDGEKMHEELVHQPVNARVSRTEHWVKAWVEQENGEQHGGEIILKDKENPRLDVYFNGKNGFGKFEVWAEDDWEMSKPMNFDSVSKIHSNLLIAWRKFSFKGKFGYGGIEEELEGYGYFQRVCVNLPTVPWFWPILMFPDGSIFSSFQPYMGLNSLRKRKRITNRFFKKFRINISNSAYFADNESNKIIQFNKSSVKEIPSDNGKINIEINTKNTKTGDFVYIILESVAITGFDLEKKLYRILHSLWNYNEHIVRVKEFSGKINGKELDKETIGNVYGNTEYVWGMSI